MMMPPLSWRAIDPWRVLPFLVFCAVIGFGARVVIKRAQPICPPVVTPALSATEMRFTAADGAELRVTVDGKHWRVVTKEARP